MGNFGIWEILLVLLVVLLVFGPKRLPEMGRSLGRGMREFKDSITGNDDDDEPAADGVVRATAAEVAPAGAPTAAAETASDGPAVEAAVDATEQTSVPAAGQSSGSAQA